MRRLKFLAIGSVVTIGFVFGMPNRGWAEDSAAAVPEAAKKEAQEIFASRCTPCHGAKGHGDGPASSGLTPPPRNLSDPEWQKSVTDDHIEKIIKFGGAAVGKSVAMPPNPDLMSKPQVVSGLRELVRSFGGK
jgi:mono/diheme cytochrome c family protein